MTSRSADPSAATSCHHSQTRLPDTQKSLIYAKSHFQPKWTISPLSDWEPWPQTLEERACVPSVPCLATSYPTAFWTTSTAKQSRRKILMFPNLKPSSQILEFDILSRNTTNRIWDKEQHNREAKMQWAWFQILIIYRKSEVHLSFKLRLQIIAFITFRISKK